MSWREKQRAVALSYPLYKTDSLNEVNELLAAGEHYLHSTSPGSDASYGTWYFLIRKEFHA